MCDLAAFNMLIQYIRVEILVVLGRWPSYTGPLYVIGMLDTDWLMEAVVLGSWLMDQI